MNDFFKRMENKIAFGKVAREEGNRPYDLVPKNYLRVKISKRDNIPLTCVYIFL
jgi:hypothetical protein